MTTKVEPKLLDRKDSNGYISSQKSIDSQTDSMITTEVTTNVETNTGYASLVLLGLLPFLLLPVLMTIQLIKRSRINH